MSINHTDENPNEESLKNTWNIGQTEYLLDNYEIYLPQTGPLKKFKNKKAMWTKLADDMFEVFGILRSASQCENRYKTILRRKKGDYNKHTSKWNRETDTYEMESSICAIDDEESMVIYVNNENSNDAIHEIAWNKQQTKYLLDKYKIYLARLGRSKKFFNKKAVWKNVADDIFNVFGVVRSAVQCENRYKTILRKTKRDDKKFTLGLSDTNEMESTICGIDGDESIMIYHDDDDGSQENAWNMQQTNYLLDKHKLYMAQIGPLKKMKNKKAMWIKVARDIFNVFGVEKSAIQCESRYKTILKRTKKEDDIKRILVSDRETDTYEMESSVCGLDVDESMVIYNDENPDDDSLKSIWNLQETKYLLEKYETYLSQTGPMKNFKNKKAMWAKVADDIRNVFEVERSAVQCENRFKTLLKRKKKEDDNGTYAMELKKIAAICAGMEPESLRGNKKVVLKIVREDQPSTSFLCDETTENTALKKQKLTDVLMEMHRQSEENRNQRHREKMQKLDKLIELLTTKNN